jgi:hypothetical protein
MKVSDMSTRWPGQVICWKKKISRGRYGDCARMNQGIRLGDAGLVVSQSVTELEVLIKDRIMFFHIAEVEVVE